jgi:hypothetical protein
MRAAKVRTTAIAVAGWLSAITGAVAADGNSFALEVLWSTPIAAIPLSRPAGTPYNPGPEPGSVFEAQAMYPDGRMVFLGSRIVDGKRVMALFADPEHDPSNHAIVLALNGSHPLNLNLSSRIFGAKPRPLTLAAGGSGKIWVGGFSNSYEDFGSGNHSDAYVAEIDADGKTLWEKAYGNGGLRQIRNVVSLPGGGVGIAGEDAGKGWLARIGSDGSQLWERHLGIWKANAIASLSGNRLVVVGFETTGSSSSGDYQEHIAAWIVDGSGEILVQTRVRNTINTVFGSNFGHVSVVATKDAIYVLSAWMEFPHAQPIEVSKLSLDGKLLWTTSLPDNNARWSPTLAVNPVGDALVVFALDGRIHLYQFDQLSGKSRENDLPLPDCSKGYNAELFLAVRNDGTMILSGSPPELNTVPRCTWVGRLTEVH